MKVGVFEFKRIPDYAPEVFFAKAALRLAERFPYLTIATAHAPGDRWCSFRAACEGTGFSFRVDIKGYNGLRYSQVESLFGREYLDALLEDTRRMLNLAEVRKEG